MRDSAFGAGDRFAKEAFTKNVGKTVPLKFEGVEIGKVKLISVIVNEGEAQAVFDFEMFDDASISWKSKQRNRDYNIVVDKQPCACCDSR